MQCPDCFGQGYMAVEKHNALRVTWLRWQQFPIEARNLMEEALGPVLPMPCSECQGSGIVYCCEGENA